MTGEFAPGVISRRQADLLNELLRWKAGFERLTVAAPLRVNYAAGVPVLTLETAGESVLAEITGNDGAAPPAHTAKRKSPASDNTVTDLGAGATFDRVLYPLTIKPLATGTLVALVSVAESRGTYWGFPLQVAFPVRLTAGWTPSVGYAWAAQTWSGMNLVDTAPLVTGNRAIATDNDTSLPAGTRGWLEPTADGTRFIFVAGDSLPCVGCGWVNALTAADCLIVTKVSGGGRCGCAGAANIKTTSGDGLSWTNGTQLITVCGKNYQVTFTKEGCDGPCLKLTEVGGGSGPIKTYTATRNCCGKNYATFSFGDPALCTDTAAEGGPAENLLTLRVEWSTCGTTDGPSAVVEPDPADLPVAISDLAVAQLQVEVAGVPSAATLRQLQLNIDHPAIGQLVVSVEDPTGNVVQLVAALPGGAGTSTGTGIHGGVVDNALDGAIQDQGGTPGVSVLGLYVPAQPLALLPANVNGVWTIFVQDTATGSTGTIQYAALGFSTADCPMEDSTGASGPNLRLPCAPDLCAFLPSCLVSFSNKTGDCGAGGNVFDTGAYGLEWDYANRRFEALQTNPPSAFNSTIRFWCDGTTWHSTAIFEGRSYTGVFVSADPYVTGEVVFDYTFNHLAEPCVGTVRFTFTLEGVVA